MIRSALALSWLAAPALAHDGSHFHPHGVEPVWALMAVALALGAGFVLGRLRK